MSRATGWLMLLLVPGLIGCGEVPLEFTEVKRIDEPVTAAEFAAFLRIVETLPEKQLPASLSVFLPPPNWAAARTLPVAELVAEERDALERLSPAALAESLKDLPLLERALHRERLNREQFVGLATAIGVAASRAAMTEEPDYAEILRRGRVALRQLEADRTPFADYSDVRQFTILRQAHWLTRLDRAEKLQQVPPENLQLVRAHEDQLREILPPEFTSDPLGTLADFEDVTGVPFQELPETGSDAQIHWQSLAEPAP